MGAGYFSDTSATLPTITAMTRFVPPRMQHAERLLLEDEISGFFSLLKTKWSVLGMRQRIASVRDHLFIYDRLDDADLTVQTQQVAQRARTHIHQQHFQEQAIAVTTSWMRRRLGMAAYDVQLSGALHLLSGRLVQLAPGEGKTLTIGLAAGVMGRYEPR